MGEASQRIKTFKLSVERKLRLRDLSSHKVVRVYFPAPFGVTVSKVETLQMRRWIRPAHFVRKARRVCPRASRIPVERFEKLLPATVTRSGALQSVICLVGPRREIRRGVSEWVRERALSTRGLQGSRVIWILATVPRSRLPRMS